MNKQISKKAISVAACAAFLITAAASGSALAAPGGNGNGKGLGNGGGGVNDGANESGVSIDVERLCSLAKDAYGNQILVIDITMENHSDDSPDVEDALVTKIEVQGRQQLLPDGPWIDLGGPATDETGWTVPYVDPSDPGYPGTVEVQKTIQYCDLLWGSGDFRLNADVKVTLANGKKSMHKGRCDNPYIPASVDPYYVGDDLGIGDLEDRVDQSLITVTNIGGCGPKE